MNATEDSKIKYLKNEISSFEARLTHVKTEIDTLRKQKEALLTEIEDIKNRSNLETEQKYMGVRKEAAVLDEEKKKVAQDKDEFARILSSFKQEKSLFEKEKQAALDMKADAQKSMEQVGIFIRMVRDGASKL